MEKVTRNGKEFKKEQKGYLVIARYFDGEQEVARFSALNPARNYLESMKRQKRRGDSCFDTIEMKPAYVLTEIN